MSFAGRLIAMLSLAFVPVFAIEAKAVSFNCPTNVSARWNVNGTIYLTLHSPGTKAYMANFATCRIPTPFTWSVTRPVNTIQACTAGTVRFTATSAGAAGEWKNAAASSPPFTASAAYNAGAKTCTWSIHVPSTGAQWKDILQNSNYATGCTCPTCGQNPPTNGPFNCP